VWMGYPNKRVSMTDVHGEPQQGGYLPAEIWHAYMSAVSEGRPCAPFAQPKESISYTPFFGKFATTGRSENNFGENEFATRPRHAPQGKNNRGKFERREQRAPALRPAPAAPPPPPPAAAPAPPPPATTPPAVGRTGGAGA